MQAKRGGGGRRKWRLLLVAGTSVLAVVFALVYVVLSLPHGPTRAQILEADPSAPSDWLAQARAREHIVFLESDGDVNRRVAVMPLEEGTEVLKTDLFCQRVYFHAGRGLCLGTDPYNGGLAIFDEDFQVLKRIDIEGIPSRARISPDGRYGSVTVFVSGHSYAVAGFSTRTAIIDMATGEPVIDNLEEIEVFRDGRRFQAIDFNFWGVTFMADSNRFYATLGTGGKAYLIEGDVQARQARVLKENVECPSLSPDGTRLVYKKRSTRGLLQQVEWQLYLLDLATMEERPISETRNVDDQVEWLDAETIVYFLRDEGPPPTIRPDLWLASVDDDTPPRRLLTHAFSPAVVPGFIP